MTLDTAIAAASQTQTARRLIDQAQHDVVDLVTVSALDLCALGAAEYPLFEGDVARAWQAQGCRRRRQLAGLFTESMLERGLLLDDSPCAGFPQADGAYALQPELGVMLAARSRPAWVIVAKADGPGVRRLALFGVNDQMAGGPSRMIVAEVPTGAPGAARVLAGPGKPGPLGRIYRYLLVSPAAAADLLARRTVLPHPRSGRAAPGRLVSAYRPDSADSANYCLLVHGDGAKATLREPRPVNGDPAGDTYDLAGLQAVMLEVIAAAS